MIEYIEAALWAIIIFALGAFGGYQYKGKLFAMFQSGNQEIYLVGRVSVSRETELMFCYKDNQVECGSFFEAAQTQLDAPLPIHGMNLARAYARSGEKVIRVTSLSTGGTAFYRPNRLH